MPPHNRLSLWDLIAPEETSPTRFLADPADRFALRDLARTSLFGERRETLRGRSVMISTDRQFLAALMLIELDGIARRLVICTPDLQVSADARLLRIALENLLRNAWKFTARQAQPRIEFGCTTGGKELIYSVRDNGVGFDPTYASKLFQPFQRLHTAEFAGTGIGLAIVDRIVRRYEGRIWGESAPDQGATFFFTLAAH